MNVKLEIKEDSRGKKYVGSFKKGGTELGWELICTTPLSGMQQEAQHRLALGQKLNTREVQDELFKLSFTQNGKKIGIPEKLYRPLLTYIVERATNFHEAPISSVWNQIVGGTEIASPFFVVEDVTIDDSFARSLFKLIKEQKS